MAKLTQVQQITMGFNEIIKGEGPVLVDFHADWCGPCKVMAPILKELKSRTGSKLRIVKVDVDRNRKVAEYYKIAGIPTLILFSKGKVLWRKSGVVSIRELEASIKTYLK